MSTAIQSRDLTGDVLRAVHAFFRGVTAIGPNGKPRSDSQPHRADPVPESWLYAYLVPSQPCATFRTELRFALRELVARNMLTVREYDSSKLVFCFQRPGGGVVRTNPKEGEALIGSASPPAHICYGGPEPFYGLKELGWNALGEDDTPPNSDDEGKTYTLVDLRRLMGNVGATTCCEWTKHAGVAIGNPGQKKRLTVDEVVKVLRHYIKNGPTKSIRDACELSLKSLLSH